MKSSDYKKEARKDLKGKWLRCVGITIIYFLIIFILGYIQGILPLRLEFLISILSIIIGIPLAFGLIASFFNIYNNKRTNVFDFISLGFSHFGKAWSIFFVREGSETGTTRSTRKHVRYAGRRAGRTAGRQNRPPIMKTMVS